MNAGAKLGAYGLLLVAVLGGGAAVGAAAGPIGVSGDAGHGSAGDPDAMAVDADLPAGGLLVSQDGYTLVPEDRLADAGEFAFTVLGPDGGPVESYDVLHDRRLHLIVASRSLTRFAHLHPELDTAGRWGVDLPPLEPGAYRAFADFRPSGADQLTLGVDLTAPGPAGEPTDLRPSRTDVTDGFEATIEGDLKTGGETIVTVGIRRDGRVVTTEPYLGAAGHLVALRDGDLAYLHVHPLDDHGHAEGPVRFAVEVPSRGTYALFFDYLVDGTVRTARFVLEAGTE